MPKIWKVVFDRTVLYVTDAEDSTEALRKARLLYKPDVAEFSVHQVDKVPEPEKVPAVPQVTADKPSEGVVDKPPQARIKRK